MAFGNPGARSTLCLLFVAAAIVLKVCPVGCCERAARSELRREMSPPVSADDLSAVAAASRAFAFDVYKATAADRSSQNVLLAPHFIWTALSMVYAGAGGQTASEIGAVLHSPLLRERFHRAVGLLDLEVASRLSGSVTLRSANALWGTDGARYETPFLDGLARHYGAAVHLTDFAGDPEGSRRRINAWVERQTEGRLTDLLGLDAFDERTSLVLVDAVYVLGRWAVPFERSETRPEPFSLLDGSSVRVPTMSHRIRVRVSRTDAFEAVELPYVGGKVVMDVVVPKGESMPAYEKTLSVETFQSLVDGLSPTDVDLSMPRFRLGAAPIRLGALLRGLGMILAFDPRQADFSPIAAELRGSLFLGDVMHAARLSVDEEGTEVAAATASGLVGAAPPSASKVRIDRPFFFSLRHVPTGAILFAGRVADPSRL